MLRCFADLNLTSEIPKDAYQADVKDTIGIGGFSTVIKGTYNGKAVAVKVMPYNAETKKYCEKEKKTLERLTAANAPHVVQYYGHSYQCDPSGRKKTLSLLMEFMEKGSLGDYIDNHQTPLCWQQRYEIMYEITTALVFIHSKNLVYSDMKGDNILLDANFHVKLCDFNFTHKKGGTNNAGTPAYSAPELILKGTTSDFASDVFSTAMVFWELAAWRRPHHGLLGREIVAKLKSTDNRLPIPADCPPNIAKLITWGWAQDPDKRPSAQQLLQELHSIKPPS